MPALDDHALTPDETIVYLEQLAGAIRRAVRWQSTQPVRECYAEWHTDRVPADDYPVWIGIYRTIMRLDTLNDLKPVAEDWLTLRNLSYVIERHGGLH